MGSALSLYLAREGHGVTLVDWGGGAKKICGEGLLPAGWQVIEELGLDPLIGRSSPIVGLSYTLCPSGQVMTAPLSQAAFGVQRPELMKAFTQALESSTVERISEGRVREFHFAGQGLKVNVEGVRGARRELSCDYLLAADGLHSPLRRLAGLQVESGASYRRWGTRCYFYSSEARHRVEVTLGEGVESYLTPLGDGLYGLAFLWSPHQMERPLAGQGAVYERLLSRFPKFVRERLPHAPEGFFGDDRAIGPLLQRVTSPLHPSHRIALVGDAAGYFDALTGEGLCLGLRQARALSGCLTQGHMDSYPSLHRSIKKRHQLVVGGLLRLIHHPQLKQAVFGALADAPHQFEAVIRVAVEEASPSALWSRQTPRFLWGLLSRLFQGTKK